MNQIPQTITEADEAPRLRAVIYLRVSTLEQTATDYGDDGYSLQAQGEACRRVAQQLGADVVEEYVDRGKSARSADRPQLQAMLKRLATERDVDLVIVHKIDRLARNRADDVQIVLAIKRPAPRWCQPARTSTRAQPATYCTQSWLASPSSTPPTSRSKPRKA